MASFFITAISLVLLVCLSFAEEVDKGKCIFDHYKKDHDLKALNKIQGLIGKKFVSVDAQSHWSFTVGICADLKIDGAKDDAGAIQKKITEDGKEDKSDPAVHNIGNLKNTHIMSGRDWALLEYRDGEAYNTHCGKEKKRTLIMLNCDESVGDGDAKMIHVEEETQKENSCYYLFEMKHRALCPVHTGGVLSVGSILLITFFSVLGLYLLVGFIYQRFVLGSKGLEQIPNYEFWKDLGNLEADGCNFVCRSKGRQNTGFRGIGDEQLESEEIRDDNLLPM